VKAHVLLDHDDYLPSYVLITEAKKSDVRVAQSLNLTAVQNRQKSSDSRCNQGLCVPGTEILKSRSPAVS